MPAVRPPHQKKRNTRPLLLFHLAPADAWIAPDANLLKIVGRKGEAAEAEKLNGLFGVPVVSFSKDTHDSFVNYVVLISDYLAQRVEPFPRPRHGDRIHRLEQL